MTFKERSKAKNSGAIRKRPGHFLFAPIIRIQISRSVHTLKMTEQDFLSTLYIKDITITQMSYALK